MFPLFPKKARIIPRIHDPATYDYVMSPDGLMTPKEQAKRKAEEQAEHDKRVADGLARRLHNIGKGVS